MYVHELISTQPQQLNKQKAFKVWQPRRAARSKRPNTPSNGTKTNGAVTHPETEVLPTAIGDLTNHL
jgi:hypothetical protein